MHGIVVKKTPTREQLLECMASHVSRYDELATGNINDPWQAHLENNRHKQIFIKKSRRVGGTRTICRKSAADGMLQLDRGFRYYGISVRQVDAWGMIDYIREFHGELPPRFRRPLGSDSKTEIEFVHPNGKNALFQAFPSKPTRSKGGRLHISEAAFIKNARDVYTGSLPSIALNPEDQVFIESNTWAKIGIFYEIDTCTGGKHRNYFRYHIPWWICPRLCRDVSSATREAPLLTTRERVYRFGNKDLIGIYESFPDEETFQVEFELKYLEALSSLFPPDLMEKLSVVNWGDDPSAELSCRVLESVPSELDWIWLNANKRGVLYGGYDVGRHRHESDFMIWDIVGDKKYLRMIIRLHKVPYRQQRQVLALAMKRCDVVRTCIDATGIGNELAENLVKDYPGRFEGVTFTSAIKDQLATRMYIVATAEEQEVFFPRYRPLFLHFVSIKKEVGSGGQTRYSVDLNEQQESARHHADMFWAAALGLQAANIKVVRGGLVVLPNVGPE